MARAGSSPGTEVPADGATKSWCIEGMAPSEIDPSDEASTGTGRQPMTSRPSSPASFPIAVRASSASLATRDRKAMPVA